VPGNKTDIHFRKEERDLLNKGLKYTLSHKNKHCIGVGSRKWRHLTAHGGTGIQTTPNSQKHHKTPKSTEPKKEGKLSGGKKKN
jgi:hypothetical protein